ncbi:hypothetical protein CFC21_084558 [Triticum aestivum]|uniref:Uncharacterized protein n=2 Tax=Triticum aestivum TaxID=4565 RepID=A0A9R1L7G0_WHEAT|nr:hypothetical protein CFC21_084558 [Triticum aestivum]
MRGRTPLLVDSKVPFLFYVRTCRLAALSTSPATEPTLALDTPPPRGEPSRKSTAATRFPLILVDDDEDASPPSELSVLLGVEKNLPDNVLVYLRNDGHLPALCARRYELCSPAAATISLRTCSGSHSVNRSRSRSSRTTAREWPAEYDRTSFAAFVPAGRDPDRIARRWVPIRCSSIASFLRCSASSSVTTSMTTAAGRAPLSAWWWRTTVISLELLLASGTGGLLASSSLPPSLLGSRLRRQTGQVTWLASHSPMQSGWKAWLHLGSSRSLSSSSNSLRHTAHSSGGAAFLPTRSALASA